jgi:hypothetical protein
MKRIVTAALCCAILSACASNTAASEASRIEQNDQGLHTATCKLIASGNEYIAHTSFVRGVTGNTDGMDVEAVWQAYISDC